MGQGTVRLWGTRLLRILVVVAAVVVLHALSTARASACTVCGVASEAGHNPALVAATWTVVATFATGVLWRTRAALARVACGIGAVGRAVVRPSSIAATMAWLLVTSTLFALGSAAPAQSAAPVNPTDASYEAGAYIIDMGQVQTVETGLKPYGLIYDLIRNAEIPVDWIIRGEKVKDINVDEIDFSANGKDYRGSAFVIRAEFATLASDIVGLWRGKGVVVDGPLPVGFAAPLYETLGGWPNVVMDEENGEKLALPYYRNAEIGSESYEIGLPSDLDTCDDLYVMPHADPEWATHQNLLPFNEAGGFIFAGCHAISVLEGIDDPDDADTDPDMNFLSASTLVGFGDHGDGTPPYEYNAPLGSDPIMQFIGSMDGATFNGSEQIFLPDADGWRDSTTLLVTDPDHPDAAGAENGDATVLAYGPGFGDPTNGLLMYAGGHSLNKGPKSDAVAAQRAFFNFHLLAGIERGLDVEIEAPATLLQGTPVEVTGTIEGGAHDYSWEWTSSCGGTFGEPTGTAAGDGIAVTTEFTPPITTSECTIRLRASDTCDRFAFAAAGREIQPSADLAIDKVDIADPVLAGDPVGYRLTVRNDGPSAASDVTVTDTLPVDFTPISASPSAGSCSVSGGTITCALGDLDPNQTATIDIVADSPLDGASSVTNVASVTSTVGDPDPTDNTTTEDTRILHPMVEIAKSTSTPIVYVGTTVDYDYAVTNPGDDPLAAVSVTDDKCDGVTFSGGDANGDGLLDPEETWTYTCSTSLSVDTTNVATVGAQDSLGNSVRDSATADVDVIDPGVGLVKVALVDDVLPGTAVEYQFTVTNEGDDALTQVVLSDARCAPLVGPEGDLGADGVLGVGESWTYTCTATLYEDTWNVAEVSAVDSLGGDVAATDEVFVNVEVPGIAVTKSTSTPMVYVGDTARYEYTVENTGEAALAPVEVVDDRCAALVRGVDVVGDGDDVLDAGETWTYMCATPLSVDTINTFTATGWADDGTSVRDSAIAEVDVIDPGIEVVKTASAAVVPLGGEVTYTYEVRNASSIRTASNALAGVVITDDKCAPVEYASGDDGDGLLEFDEFGVSEVWIYTCTATLTDTTTNVVTVGATDALGNEVPEATDTATVVVDFAPRLVVEKSGAAEARVGETVEFTFVVSHDLVAGDGSDVTDVVVIDDVAGTAEYASGDDGDGLLESHESWIFTAAYTFTAADPAVVVNTVIVDGTDRNDEPLPAATDDHETAVIPVADIALDKSSGGTYVPGESLTYTLTVTNHGPSAATGVTVTDRLPAGTTFEAVAASQGGCVEVLGTVSCVLGELAAGATADVTITVLVDSATRGDLVNVATAASTTEDPDESNNDDDDVAAGKPVADLVITKTAAEQDVLIGSTTTFVITVQNLGPSTAEAVTVTDLVPDGLTLVGAESAVGTFDYDTAVWTVGDLAPGAIVKLGVTAVVVVAGELVNVAEVASATDDPDPSNNSDTQAVTGRLLSHLTGLVWLDEDGNGALDAGEEAVDDVRLELVFGGPDGICGTADDVFQGTTETASDYWFRDLEPGTYEVRVDLATVPDAWRATYDLDGNLDSIAVVTVKPGETFLHIDFGFTANEQLPRTGAELGGFAMAGVLMLSVGLIVLAVTRRRDEEAEPAISG